MKMASETTSSTTTAMTAPTKLTFGFSKKLSAPKLLETSAISDPSARQTKEETDFVLEVNEAEGVKGTLIKAEKKGPLIIPCKTVNDWAVKSSNNDARKRTEKGDENEAEMKKRRVDDEEKHENGAGTKKPERTIKSNEKEDGEETKKKNDKESTEDAAVKELIEEAK